MNSFIGKVKDLSPKGTGIVDSPDGRIIFIPGVWPGDEGEFEVLKWEKRFGIGKLIKIYKKSLDRIEPPCTHHGFNNQCCGGCPWLMIDYKAQLKAKDQLIKSQLTRNQLVNDSAIINSIQPAQKIFGYRNRAQFKTNGQQIGYVESQSKNLVPIKQCLVLNEKISEKFNEILKKLPNKNWEPKPPYLWNFIELDEQLEINQLRINNRRPFQQANSDQNDFMKKIVKNWSSQFKPEDSIIELFCGSGNFTRVLSLSDLGKIIAIESFKEAVNTLNSLKINNTKAHCFNLNNKNNFLKIKSLNQDPTCILLDPPREGFELIDLFLNNYKSINNIMYISCDLVTFVRDTKKIIKSGYKLVKITPVDQFPHTPHIELLAEFIKI